MTRQDRVYATISPRGDISVPPRPSRIGTQEPFTPNPGGEFQMSAPREFRVTIDT